MKKILSKAFAIALATIVTIPTFATSSFAAETTKKAAIDEEYVDFSSDRSTYFFRIDGGDKKTVFFDFYSPFDPTVKVESYDPLVMYKLDDEYSVENNILMMNIKDLEKLYDPYFDYKINGNTLNITYTFYEKLIIDGYGERSTTLKYTKKVWNLKIDLKNNTAVYDYTEYMPTVGGRNKSELSVTDVNKEKSTTNNKVTLKGKIKVENDNYYVPASEIMEIMDKEVINEEGYLSLQQKDLPDVTVEVEHNADVDDVKVPSASNIYNGGALQKEDKNYTWADYMNDVADNKRTTGWLWRAFYIPSGENFKDGNGETISLEADRIVPFTMYVPTTYDKDETRLTYMLHGGTGNENTPTHRIVSRDINIEDYAEKYNYIIVTPNGWTQNPIWRENQALYSFEKSFEMVMNEFPVDEGKVFMSGNSLGGRGALELTTRFADKFKAVAASAPKIAEKVSSGGNSSSSQSKGSGSSRGNSSSSQSKGSGSSGGRTKITIEDTKYDLSQIKDKPALIIQGTADTTTSFKVQVGSSTSPGSIPTAIMNKLENATYVTVEDGNHSYAYASVLETMFDFFESTLEENSSKEVNEVTLKEKSKKVIIDNKKEKLTKSIKVVDDTAMISLDDLQQIYGDDFKIYEVNSYDSNPRKAIDYYTLTYNNQTLNITVGETTYRKNLERYKEDALSANGSVSDEDLLENAPKFSVAPYIKGDSVYVPAVEVLQGLNLNVQVEKSTTNVGAIIGAVVIIAGIGIISFKKFRK